MRCQFCQQPISLLRRLSDPEFCSAKHREEYAQRESAMALARLRPVAKQAASRERPPQPTSNAVAVMEPGEMEVRGTLAGVIPSPPLQTRSYWCYELPADPIDPPIGVMLREAPMRWRDLEPAWATSVVAMWPVNQPSRPEAGHPLPPAQFHFALPASPLYPLPWIGPEGPAVPEARESLIPLIILPAWSLPHRQPEATAADPFPVDLLRPAVPVAGGTPWAFAPAVKMTAGLGRAPSLVPVPIPEDPLAFGEFRPSKGTSLTPFASGALAQEQQNYVQRMEQQLLQLAEQTGLYGRLPAAAPAGRPLPPASRGAAAECSFGERRMLPAFLGTRLTPDLATAVGLPPSGPRTASVPVQSCAGNVEPLPCSAGVAWPVLPARSTSDLTHGELVAPPAVSGVAPVIRLATAGGEPHFDTLYCWPSSRHTGASFALVDRLARSAEPLPQVAAAPVQEPVALPAEPLISRAVPVASTRPTAAGLTPGPTTMAPLPPPSRRTPASQTGAELHPHPGRPSVIVPVSAGVDRTRSSVNRQNLVSIKHLFPGLRDQASRNARLETCAWRGKPVLPPTRLPRISLQERNATRAHALKDVRQVLQQQTIDRARRFWKLAPADLKWLALALPLILGVWLWPKEPVSVSVPSPVAVVKTTAKTAAGSSYLEKVLQSNLNLGGFEERIANRSSIHLEEDFSAGLGLWDGDGNWARSWFYDKSGVVRPGRMAIYQPSIPMEDYQLALTAAVERRSISWMVRATNLRNYIAARLNVMGTGANQRLTFERWTVKEGRVTRRQVLPLATTLGSATTARIRMEVTGNTFTTMLQDQVIDVFTDSSHPTGGVGLFSTDGDQPRIYRLELTHQHDFFGKLCSFLAPHPITKAGTIRP
jgi:hypothetical protein